MGKQFISELSRRTGRDRRTAETLLEAVAKALLIHCGELDSVAIPSFGNFEAIKHDERIVVDRSSGSHMLLPPEIELTFRPAGKLRKLIDSKSDE